ncbi:MAG: hypothetical protein LUE99_05995 [Bacteroides sp.]|nr:hypothetical protein [Bacteroides sp.]
MELQATALQDIVKSADKNEVFYLLPIQDLSALQELKGHLITDVLSNAEEQSTEYRLDAIRTLNSFVAELSLHDGDHYEVMDTVLKTLLSKRYYKRYRFRIAEKRNIPY